MKKVLSIDYDLTDDYTIIAISSPLKDYKLCWNLNLTLKADFLKLENFKFNLNQNQTEEYSFYHYYNQNNKSFYYLVSNKNNNRFLMEKLRNLDYFLLIKGFMTESYILSQLSGIKKVPNILTAFFVDKKKLSKEMNLFLSEIELHYINVIKNTANHLFIQ